MNANEIMTLYLQELFSHTIDGENSDDFSGEIWRFWNKIHDLAKGEVFQIDNTDIEKYKISFVSDEVFALKECTVPLVRRLIEHIDEFRCELGIGNDARNIDFWAWLYCKNTEINRIKNNSEKQGKRNSSDDDMKFEHDIDEPTNINGNSSIYLKRKIRSVLGVHIKKSEGWKRSIQSNNSNRMVTQLKNLYVHETIIFTYLFTAISDYQSIDSFSILELSKNKIANILNPDNNPSLCTETELIDFFLGDIKVCLEEELHNDYPKFEFFDEPSLEDKSSLIKDQSPALKACQLKNLTRTNSLDDITYFIDYVEGECADFKYLFRIIFALIYLSNHQNITFVHKKESDRTKAFNLLGNIFEEENDAHTQNALKQLKNRADKKYIWGETTHNELNRNIKQAFLNDLDEALRGFSCFRKLEAEYTDLQCLNRLHDIYFQKRDKLKEDQFISFVYLSDINFLQKLIVIASFYDLLIHYREEGGGWREADSLDEDEMIIVRNLRNLNRLCSKLCLSIRNAPSQKIENDLSKIIDSLMGAIKDHSHEIASIKKRIDAWLDKIEKDQPNQLINHTEKRNYLRKFFTIFWTRLKGKHAENVDSPSEWLNKVDDLLDRRLNNKTNDDDPYVKIVARIKKFYSSKPVEFVGSEGKKTNITDKTKVDFATLFEQRHKSSKYKDLLKNYKKVRFKPKSE